MSNSAYTSVANPRYADSTHDIIFVDVVFAHLGTKPIKFGASASDVVDYGREIYADIVAGKYGVIAESDSGEVS